MSNGGFIGFKNTPSATSASGVWSLREQLRAQRDGIWPGNFITVEYLAIGGGGGGSGGTNGVYWGGGGAAGVLRASTTNLSLGVTYQVTIGAGASGTGQSTGVPGSTTTFATIAATGGNSNPHNNVNGGSNDDYAGGVGTGTYPNGGGAGSGSAGSNINGGAATVSSITGSAVSYGGGGGGQNSSAIGTPGTNGGASVKSGNGGNGTTNTGSGAGGCGSANLGGNGGSGVIVLKIPDTFTASFSGGVSQTNSTSGGFKIYTITAAGVSDTVTFS